MDFFDGCIDEEQSAQKHNQTVAIEITTKNRSEVNLEPRGLEHGNELQNHKQQKNAKCDRQNRSDLAHIGLAIRRHALGFNGNIKQVVKAQDCFKRCQNQQSREIFNGEEIGKHGCGNNHRYF